jgi:Sulfotransferase family
MADVLGRPENGVVTFAETAADPVFVLCMGRSGSTLLRFVLDAHPELACPPETSLPALCGQLAVVWSLIEGAPLSEVRGDTPPEVPDPAVAGIRHMVDLMTGSYLERRGKRRFCDKSLGSARFADLLVRAWPEAKFLCLYRHPMDVIRSGLDACPWGLNGYGFDGYIGSSPGNAVLALARYWLDNAQAIAAAEEQFPDRCHRVRYEDLTADPAGTAAGIFDFLGVDQVDDIEARSLAADHERFGPGDHKIWHTTAITTGSVGGGESVPTGLIPPPILEGINELAAKLGYVAVDEKWGTADAPAELRADVTVPVTTDTLNGSGPSVAAVSLLAGQLRDSLAGIDAAFQARWAACLDDAFTVAVRSPGGRDEQCWEVDLAGRRLTEANRGPAADTDPDQDQDQDQDADQEDDDGPDWSVVGTPRAWESVLLGERNLSAALRACELRYCDTGDTGIPATAARIAMLSELLGVTPRERPQTVGAGHSAMAGAMEAAGQ